jgi:hypothetical protein
MSDEQTVTLRVVVSLKNADRMDGEQYRDWRNRVEETATKRVRESLQSDNRIGVSVVRGMR